MHIVLLAAFSRLLVIGFALLSSWVFAPYDSSGQFVSSNVLSPLANWDGAHFLHVARSGYRFEHSFAFFPGFPMIVNVLARWMDHVTAAVLLSNVCFVVAAHVLCLLCGRRAAVLFLISPANIFFSAAYTESLFALLLFLGCFFLERRAHVSACAAFFASAVVRSNGAVFAILLLVRGEIVLACVVGVPFVLQNLKCALLFCVHDSQPWCFKGWIPNCYGHVQSFYWNNGFLAYWTWNNVPNFLLAVPMLFLASLVARRAWKSKAHALSSLETQLNSMVALLALLCLFSMNVQVGRKKK